MKNAKYAITCEINKALHYVGTSESGDKLILGGLLQCYFFDGEKEADEFLDKLKGSDKNWNKFDGDLDYKNLNWKVSEVPNIYDELESK